MNVDQERRVWTKAQSNLRIAKTISQFIVAAYKLLNTARYLAPVKKKFTTKYLPDKASITKQLVLRKVDLDDYAFGLDMKVVLDELVKSGQALIYSPVPDDKDNMHKHVVLTAVYMPTGGGHNDSPSYEYHLCITVARQQQIVLY